MNWRVIIGPGFLFVRMRGEENEKAVKTRRLMCSCMCVVYADKREIAENREVILIKRLISRTLIEFRSGICMLWTRKQAEIAFKAI